MISNLLSCGVTAACTERCSQGVDGSRQQDRKDADAGLLLSSDERVEFPGRAGGAVDLAQVKKFLSSGNGASAPEQPSRFFSHPGTVRSLSCADMGFGTGKESRRYHSAGSGRREKSPRYHSVHWPPRHRSPALAENDLSVSPYLSERLGLVGLRAPAGTYASEPQANIPLQRRSSSAEDHLCSLGGERSNGPNAFTRSLWIFTRLNKFRKTMTMSKPPTDLEIERGIHIEGVYDFYTFENKRINTRKIKTEAIHTRSKDDSEDDESVCSSRSSTSSPSDGTRSPGSSRLPSKSDEAAPGGAAEPHTSAGADDRDKGRGRKIGMPNLSRFHSTIRNQEAISHWGVLSAKLLRSKELQFRGTASRSTAPVRRVIRAPTVQKGCMLTAVRCRAQVVARQAWELAKRVAREPEDCFDETWKEKDLLVHLFSTEYVDTLFLFANAARTILSVQPSLAEAKVPCKVFGDIHGQFRDMLLIFHAFGNPAERDAPTFVFNGDFIDRGAHQLEVIGLLLALKVLLPEKVWLIRGNHEFRYMNERYGFKDECYNRLGREFGPMIYETIHKCFEYLPLACVIEDNVLVVHGGIGDAAWSMDDVRAIQRPLRDDQIGDPANYWIYNLLWSDPIEDDAKNTKDVFGVHESPRGGLSTVFGWNVTKTFCARNGLSLIIRSHQSKQNSVGFDIMHENLLIRIFSARDYEGHGNDGAVLSVWRSDPDDPDSVMSVRPQVLQATTKAQHEEFARESLGEASDECLAVIKKKSSRPRRRRKSSSF